MRVLWRMQLTPAGVLLQGNPTGSGVSHLYIKPNFNLPGGGLAGQPSPQPSNVQFSVGNGKDTATKQLQARVTPQKGVD